MSEERSAGWPTVEEAREAMKEGKGAGIKVAVIDSGVDATHPRLSKMRLVDSVGFDESGGSVNVVENAGTDSYGHGTAVADIIHRLAPEAEIGSFRVIDARSLSRTHLICAGVNEAIKRGYHVLNCSFGCRGLAKFIMPYKDWADRAWLQNIHVVAACSNTDSSEAEWPAHFANVFGVDLADSETDDIYFNPDHMVNFSARGENVEVAWMGGGVQLQTGTSFAAPLISAHISRILSVYPNTAPSMMHTILSNLSEPWHPGLSPDW